MLPQFNPEISIGDFEASSMNAFIECFTNIQSFGCYFHFRQAVLRKLGELNLKKFYLNNQTANKWFNLLFGIGFLPISHMQLYFIRLTRFIPGNIIIQQKIQKFLNYFTRTWLTELHKINWFNSPYLTNNFSETFNKRLKSVIKTHNSSHWKFIESLNNIIKDIYLDKLRIGNNLQTTRQRAISDVINIPAELKNALINNQIESIEFVRFILNINDLPDEIISFFYSLD